MMATPIPPNEAEFSAQALGSLPGARWVGGPARAVRGVTTDSRAVLPGNLFVALRGERHDGHAFAREAVARGAAAVMLASGRAADELGDADVAVLEVPDPLVAYGQLARAHRESLERAGSLRLVVAITGSVGKTGTKEMCAHVLEALGERVLRTRGNLNNRIGVPATLLSLRPEHTAAVIEAGMNLPGELALLGEMIEPHVGIVTAVAAVHTEGVGDLAAVAREKASLLHAVRRPPAGPSAAIFTADDRVVLPLASASPASVHLRTGAHEDADVRLLSRRRRADGSSACLYAIHPLGNATSTHVEIALRLHGDGAARNAACALALALVIGGNRALDSACRALEDMRPERGRGAPLDGVRGTTVIDDSYNASRRSVVNALEAAAELARARQTRLVAVLGDMLELGVYEEEEHARVGEAVARVGVSLFVACGPRMRIAAAEAREMGADLVVEEDDPLAAVSHIVDFVRPGDVVVVKGSRSMAMERVVEALVAPNPGETGGSDADPQGDAP